MGPVGQLLESLERLTRSLHRSVGFYKQRTRRLRERVGMGVGKLRRSRRTDKRRGKRRLEQGRLQRKKEALGYSGRWLGPR